MTIAGIEKVVVIERLKNAVSMGFFGKIDTLLILQLRQFLLMAIRDYYGQGIAPHHAFIGAGTTGHQDILKGNIESLSYIAQRLPLGGA